MPTSVSDIRSNANDQIAFAARVIGRAAPRRVVFDAVCSGKKQVKTVGGIAESTGLTRKQVLTAGKYLVHNQILRQTKMDGDTAYEKEGFYANNKVKILALAGDPTKLATLPTKTNPHGGGPTTTLKVQLPKRELDVRHITVDDIGSLAKVQRVKKPSKVKMSEQVFKAGFQAVVGEEGEFRDWGGEKNDLWTTQLRVTAKRLRAAIAFKGPGQRGALTPKKLGKNGDQIQRLFDSDADVFLVQYWDQVAPSVYEQMKVFAAYRALTTRETVWWGVIDGTDSARLIAAYPHAFQQEDRK